MNEKTKDLIRRLIIIISIIIIALFAYSITPKTFPAPEDAKPLPQPERVWGNASLEWWIPEWKDMPTQYHIVQGLASLPILRVVGASKVHLWHYNDVYHQKAIE